MVFGRRVAVMSKLFALPAPVGGTVGHSWRATLTRNGRCLLGCVGLLLWARSAGAEPYVSTTANRAVQIAPWSVWTAALAVLVLVPYPLITLWVLGMLGVSRPAWRWGVAALSLLHGLSGVACLQSMALLSVGYVNVSPFVFVGAWFGLVVLVTVVYCAVARRRNLVAG